MYIFYINLIILKKITLMGLLFVAIPHVYIWYLHPNELDGELSSFVC